MKNEPRTEMVTREDIVGLLSDDEVASVSTEEAPARMSRGDEYLDLEHLDQGVRRALDATTPMSEVLPRKAVRELTWSRILMRLAPDAPRSHLRLVRTMTQ